MSVTTDQIGGNGGNGGSSTNGGGGGGGAGGFGIYLNGTGAITVNSGVVVRGGNGGNGGNTQAYSQGGTGGGGGVGVFGSGTLINAGTISSGAGGGGGTGPSNGGAISVGVAGVVGTGLAITNSGSIVGGTGSTGQVDAITYLGGANSLTLSSGGVTGSLTGNVGITGSLSIDPGTVAGTPVTFSSVIHDAAGGAGSLTKVGVGTLVLSSANTYTGGTFVAAGVLQLNATNNLAGNIYVTGGTLRYSNLAGTGSSTVHLIDPTVDFATTGTNSTNYSLDVASPASADHSVFNNSSGGLVVLAGSITTGTGNNGQGAAIDATQYVDYSGAGVTRLTSTANSWTGVTTINNGATVQGATDTISGGSITDNGALVYRAVAAAGSPQASTQAISGTGTVDVTASGVVTLNGNITNTSTLSVSGTGSTLSIGGTRSNGADPVSLSAVLLNGTNSTVSVATSGAIQGGGNVGIGVTGTNDTVTNLGSIANTASGGNGVNAGVAIYSIGGADTITNGAVGNTTATISGYNNAINQRGNATSALTINNFGTLTSTVYSAFENSGSAGALTVNNTGTNALIYANNNGASGLNVNAASGLNLTNSGTIAGASNGVSSAGAATISNSGTIGAGTVNGAGVYAAATTGSGVSLTAGGSIDNGASANSAAQNAASVIQGGRGVYSTGVLTLTNYGTVTGTTATLAAIDTNGAASAITNYGTIQGGTQGIVLNNGGTVYNYGTGSVIKGTTASNANDASGVYSNGTLSLTNQGTITTVSTGASYGVEVTAAGTGANMIANSGKIVGVNGGVYLGAAGTITNSGTIGGGTLDGSGNFTAGGAGFAIRTVGGTVTNSGTLQSGGAAVYQTSTTGTLNLVNTGTIGSLTTTGAPHNTDPDDTVVALGAATIFNGGTIASPNFFAVDMAKGGTLTNAAGGSISAGNVENNRFGVFVNGASGTVNNYGSITSTSTDLHRGIQTDDNAATINLYAGSTTGAIATGAGNDSLTLYTGTGTGFAGATYDSATNAVTAGITTGATKYVAQQASTNAAAAFVAGATVNLGTGTNTLTLAGAGDGTTGNGAVGTLNVATISGATKLVKQDAGTWMVTGLVTNAGGAATNTNFAGGTSVLAGTLAVETAANSYAADALGTGTVAISTGATVRYDNPYTTATPGPSGAQIYISSNSFTGSGTLAFAGATGSLSVIDHVNGTAGVAMAPTGTIAVQSGSVLARGSTVFAGNQANLDIATGASFDGGSGAAITVNALTGGGSYVGDGLLTVGVAGGGGIFSGTIANEGTNIASLTKTGAGTETLTGVNTYTGATTISAGTLALSGAGSMANTAVTDNATFTIFDHSGGATIGSLAGTGVVTLGANNLSVGGNNTTTTFSGVIGAGGQNLNGGLTKQGTGTLTLTGANTYTGVTTINAGTLQGTTTSIVGSSIVDNATLAYNQSASGTSSLGISGSGTVTVTGLAAGNTLTVSGTDTQTGGFVVTDASATVFAGKATGAANEVTLNGTGAALTNNAGSVIVGTAYGVTATGSSTVVNNGTIASGTYNAGTGAIALSGNDGVYLAAGGTVTNNAGGLIEGARQGVEFAATGGRLNNAGTITSTGNGNVVADFSTASTGVIVANSGTINFVSPTTGAWGVALYGIGANTVTNTGTIAADVGVELQGTAATTLTNGQGGQLTGTTYGIQTSGAGTLTFANYGNVTGPLSVLATGANILSLQAGSTTGAITTGSGADTLSLYTGSVTTAALVDATTGLTVQTAGAHAAAAFGAINLGTGTNVLNLRGIGDGNAANGAAAGLALNMVTNVGTIVKQDTGTWTLTGAATASVANATINAGIGGTPGSGGLLIFAGSGLTGTINVNGAIIRAIAAGAFGTGTINAIDPTIQYAATGTYANQIVLQSANPAADPTTLQTYGAGITATLTGAITQTNAPQPLVFSSINTDGTPGTGTFVLTNAGNAWTGVTTVNAGTTLRGTTATLSGSNFTDNGVLNFNQATTGTSARAISGTGNVVIDGGGTVALTGAITAGGGVQVGANTTATLSNVSGTGITTVTLSGNNAVLNVAQGGTIAATNGGAVFGVAQNGTINNAGTITSTGNSSAIFFNPNLGTATVTNTGTVNAFGSAVSSGAGTVLTVDNSGMLTSANRPAVFANGAAIITNGAGGTIDGFFGVYANGDLALNNAGQITAAGNGGNAVTANGGGTIVNTGTLTATTAGGWGVQMSGSGSVDNQGTINADSGLVATTDTGVSFSNEGTVTATSNGVWGYATSVNLTNTGIITGGGATDTAAVRAEAAGSSITNGGTIQSSSTVGVGVYMTGGTLTNQSGGTISGGMVAGGGYGTAIQLAGTGNVLNLQAGSTVNGLIDASGTTDASNGYTFSGNLNGGFTGGSGDDVVTLVTPATVTGTLDGGAGTDTLVLDGTAAGTLDAAQVVNFENGVKQGSGTWTLTGTTTAASPTSFAINAGTLAVAGGDALSDASAVTIAAAGTLQLNDSETIGSLAGAGNVVLGTNTLTTGGLNASPTFSGVASGTGGLTKVGTGTLTLSGANTYTGATTVNAGTLALGASDVIADASAVIVATGATFDLGANSDTVASLALNGTLSGTGTLTAATYTLNGATVNANLGAGTLTQASGTSMLNGIAGAAIVNVAAGTLMLGANDRLADNAAVTIANGAVLDLGAFTDTVGTATVNGTLNGTGTLTAATYTLNGGTVNANLGAGTLNQAGGTSMLNGTAGAATVNVNAGTLALGASDRLADTATVTIATGAILDLGANSDTVGLVGIAGTLNGTGTLSAAEYDLSGAVVNANLGTGNLFQQAGTSTLNGTAGAANVMVTGGTLVLGASDRLADNAAVGVATGATLNLGANTDTVGTLALNGTLAGTGTLTAATYTLSGAAVNANLGTGTLVQAGGTSVLTGTTATNIVAVMAGTLRLGASDRIADSAMLGVATGATFDLAGYNETVATLAGGGTLALGAGTLTAGGTNADYAFGGNVTGTGDLTKVGTGTFSLIGNEAMTGRLNVNAGTVMLAGTTAGSVRVQGGTLTGASAIAGNLLLSSGTLSPGIATQPVAAIQAGSLTVTGGTTVFDFGGMASGFTADLLKITGAASLSGGTVTTRGLDPSAAYKMEQTYTVVQAGTLTGTYANGATFAPVSNNADLYYRLRYDLVANGVVLEIRKPVDFTTTLGTGATRNQLAVAGALNGGVLTGSDAFVTALNAIAQLSPDQRRAALDNIGGESIADISTSVALIGDRFNELLRHRVAVGGAGNSADPSLIAGIAGGKRGLDQVRASGQVGAEGSSFADGSRDNHAGAWVQTFGGAGRLDGSNGTARVTDQSYGVAAGIDAKVAGLSIGGAFAASALDTRVEGRSATNRGTLYQGGGYVAYDNGLAYASAVGSYFSGDVDSSRQVYLGAAFQGNATGTSRVTGYTAGGAAGYRLPIGGGVRFTPQVSVQATHVDRGAFTETGAGVLSLSVGKDVRNLYTATAEGRLSYLSAAPGGIIEPYAGAGVAFNFGDLDTLAANRFTGAPTGTGAFSVAGARLSPTTALINGGIEAHPNDRVTLGMGVETRLSNRERDGRVELHVKLGF